MRSKRAALRTAAPPPKVLDLVKRNEYKRRQGRRPGRAPSAAAAFGRDWRYPITSGYRALERAARPARRYQIFHQDFLISALPTGGTSPA